MALSSCGKKGCTDSTAINYCEKCKKNDGSCQYKATVQFWFNKTTSDNLIANGYTAIHIIVDGDEVGPIPVGAYSGGTCGINTPLTDNRELGNNSTKTFSCHVEGMDSSGDYTIVFWSGDVKYDGTKSCTSHEFIY